MSPKIKSIIVIIISAVIFLPLISFAADTTLLPEGDMDYDSTPHTLCNALETVDSFRNFCFTYLTPIAIACIILSGLFFMISGFSPELKKKAITALWASASGLVLILLAWLIITIIFIASGWTDNDKWWQFECQEGSPEQDYPEPQDPNDDPIPRTGCKWTNPSTGTTYRCQINTNGSCNCDQFNIASESLKIGLTCMEDYLGEPFDNISGIGDSGSKGYTYEKCSNPRTWRSDKCHHSQYSHHYGCHSNKGESYAIDFGDEENEDRYRWAAERCGANMNQFFGPSSNNGHDNHVHISFCR